ncbi:hypothetical protein NFJ02_15g21190 [Pycnococcus provasolii]
MTFLTQQTAQKAVQRVTVTEDQPQPSTFLLVDTNTNTTWPTKTTFAPACQPRSASKFQLSKSDGIFEYQPSPDKFSTTANDVDVFSYEAVRVNEQGRLVRAAALVEVYIEPRNDAPIIFDCKEITPVEYAYPTQLEPNTLTEWTERVNRLALSYVPGSPIARADMRAVSSLAGKEATCFPGSMADGDTLTWRVLVAPEHGTVLARQCHDAIVDKTSYEQRCLAVNEFTQIATAGFQLPEPNSFVYIPDAGFQGTDAFTYEVSDELGRNGVPNEKPLSARATISFKVGDVSSIPSPMCRSRVNMAEDLSVCTTGGPGEGAGGIVLPPYLGNETSYEFLATRCDHITTEENLGLPSRLLQGRLERDPLPEDTAFLAPGLRHYLCDMLPASAGADSSATRNASSFCPLSHPRLCESAYDKGYQPWWADAAYPRCRADFGYAMYNCSFVPVVEIDVTDIAGNAITKQYVNESAVRRSLGPEHGLNGQVHVEFDGRESCGENATFLGLNASLNLAETCSDKYGLERIAAGRYSYQPLKHRHGFAPTYETDKFGYNIYLVDETDCLRKDGTTTPIEACGEDCVGCRLQPDFRRYPGTKTVRVLPIDDAPIVRGIVAATALETAVPFNPANEAHVGQNIKGEVLTTAVEAPMWEPLPPNPNDDASVHPAIYNNIQRNFNPNELPIRLDVNVWDRDMTANSTLKLRIVGLPSEGEVFEDIPVYDQNGGITGYQRRKLVTPTADAPDSDVLEQAPTFLTPINDVWDVWAEAQFTLYYLAPPLRHGSPLTELRIVAIENYGTAYAVTSEPMTFTISVKCAPGYVATKYAIDNVNDTSVVERLTRAFAFGDVRDTLLDLYGFTTPGSIGTCSRCAPGYFSTTFNTGILPAPYFAPACMPCSAGSSSPGGLTYCLGCPSNTYSDAPASVACTACPAQASSEPGASSRDQCICEAGTFGPNGGPCRACPLPPPTVNVVGTYGDQQTPGYCCDDPVLCYTCCKTKGLRYPLPMNGFYVAVNRTSKPEVRNRYILQSGSLAPTDYPKSAIFRPGRTTASAQDEDAHWTDVVTMVRCTPFRSPDPLGEVAGLACPALQSPEQVARAPEHCAPGYEGYGCSECASGYYRENGACLGCPNPHDGFLAVRGIVLIATFFLLALAAPTLLLFEFQICTILVQTLQLMSLLAYVPVGWPERMYRTWTELGVVNLVTEAYLRPECGSDTFINRGDLAWTLLIPAIAAGGYALIMLSFLAMHGIVVHVLSPLLKRPPQDFAWAKPFISRESLVKAGRACAHATVAFLHLTSLPMAHASYQPFRCTTNMLDAQRYLVGHPDKFCESGSSGLGLLGLCFYLVAILSILSTAVITAGQSGMLERESTVGFLGVLYYRYEGSFFWYEFVRIVRNQVVVGLVALLPRGELKDGVRICGTLLVLFTISILHLFYARPYDSIHLQVADTTSQVLLMVLIFSGFFFHVPQELVEGREFISGGFRGGLEGVIFCLIGVFFATWLWSALSDSFPRSWSQLVRAVHRRMKFRARKYSEQPLEPTMELPPAVSQFLTLDGERHLEALERKAKFANAPSDAVGPAMRSPLATISQILDKVSAYVEAEASMDAAAANAGASTFEKRLRPETRLMVLEGMARFPVRENVRTAHFIDTLFAPRSGEVRHGAGQGRIEDNLTFFDKLLGYVFGIGIASRRRQRRLSVAQLLKRKRDNITAASERHGRKKFSVSGYRSYAEGPASQHARTRMMMAAALSRGGSDAANAEAPPTPSMSTTPTATEQREDEDEIVPATDAPAAAEETAEQPAEAEAEAETEAEAEEGVTAPPTDSETETAGMAASVAGDEGPMPPSAVGVARSFQQHPALQPSEIPPSAVQTHLDEEKKAAAAQLEAQKKLHEEALALARAAGAAAGAEALASGRSQPPPPSAMSQLSDALRRLFGSEEAAHQAAAALPEDHPSLLEAREKVDLSPPSPTKTKKKEEEKEPAEVEDVPLTSEQDATTTTTTTTTASDEAAIPADEGEAEEDATATLETDAKEPAEVEDVPLTSEQDATTTTTTTASDEAAIPADEGEAEEDATATLETDAPSS